MSTTMLSSPETINVWIASMSSVTLLIRSPVFD